MRARNIKTDDHPNNKIQGWKQPKVRQGRIKIYTVGKGTCTEDACCCQISAKKLHFWILLYGQNEL